MTPRPRSTTTSPPAASPTATARPSVALDAQLETLRKEKRYYTQSWAQREQRIEKTRANLAGMVADLVRIGAELPSTALAELPAATLAVLPPGAVPALPSVPD